MVMVPTGAFSLGVGTARKLPVMPFIVRRARSRSCSLELPSGNIGQGALAAMAAPALSAVGRLQLTDFARPSRDRIPPSPPYPTFSAPIKALSSNLNLLCSFDESTAILTPSLEGVTPF
jgi:hypothetical protein